MNNENLPEQKESANAGCVRRLVSRRREQLALEALVALALRNDTEEVTDAEIERYTRRPVRLTRKDQAALDRARPKLLAALKRELRPDAKRLESGWGKPANDSSSPTATEKSPATPDNPKI